MATLGGDDGTSAAGISTVDDELVPKNKIIARPLAKPLSQLPVMRLHTSGL